MHTFGTMFNRNTGLAISPNLKSNILDAGRGDPNRHPPASWSGRALVRVSIVVRRYPCPGYRPHTSLTTRHSERWARHGASPKTARAKTP